MFKYYNNLGFNNPYFFIEKGKFKVYKKFSQTIENYSEEKNIDPVAVIEMFNKEFVFGDRTLIQNIKKTPWLAKPNKSLDTWEYDIAPKHGMRNIEEKEIAKMLFEKICNEIEHYIGDKKNIGILLSGGMDSRMVAGALDYLIKKGKIVDLKVTALTWGNTNTRDVVYAKRIAERLNWQWKHYTVTAKDLLNNIKEAAIYGCEYSPIHLHAMPQIRDDNNLDILLGGSYGDSIGRAEYGGKNVRFLESLLNNIKNVSGLFRQNVYAESLNDINKDVQTYHEFFPREEVYMQNELDYQLHYMRRMLNPCMDIFNQKMVFCQVFSSPEVYGFMWSLNPEKRNDKVYKYMQREFVTNLEDIPWARTGIGFGEKNGVPDTYLKRHHTYVEIIQNEILQDIKNCVLTEDFKKTGIFRYKSIKILFTLIKHFPMNSLYYLEKVIWLASLAEMIKLYKINVKEKEAIPKLVSSEYSIVKEYLKRYLRNRTGSYLRKFKLIN
jgi:asparagine synthase (glutamine-hydrolysing)